MVRLDLIVDRVDADAIREEDEQAASAGLDIGRLRDVDLRRLAHRQSTLAIHGPWHASVSASFTISLNPLLAPPFKFHLTHSLTGRLTPDDAAAGSGGHLLAIYPAYVIVLRRSPNEPSGGSEVQWSPIVRAGGAAAAVAGASSLGGERVGGGSTGDSWLGEVISWAGVWLVGWWLPLSASRDTGRADCATATLRHESASPRLACRLAA